MAATGIPLVLRENPNFRRYYIGRSVSMLGDQITLIALPLTAVLALHATAGEMGALTTAYLLPNLLLSLHAGLWIDRRGRRRQTMLAADLAAGLLMATIPIAYALGQLTWVQLYLVSFLLGSFSIVANVAYGGFFQTVVPRDRYVEANSLLHGTRGASFLAGSTLGGTLVALLRGPYALAVDAASFLWSALFLRRIDAVEPPGAPPDSGGLVSGLRWIRGNAIFRAELMGVATLNLFNFIYFALFTLHATRSLHVHPAALGLVMGSAAAGTLPASYLTSRIAARIGGGPTLIVGCAVFAAPLVLVPAAACPHWLILVFLFTAEMLSGIGLMLLDILAGAINPARVPRSSGRASRAPSSSSITACARSARQRRLGSSLGVRPTLWIATVGALAGLVFLIPSPIRTLQTLPVPD